MKEANNIGIGHVGPREDILLINVDDEQYRLPADVDLTRGGVEYVFHRYEHSDPENGYPTALIYRRKK
jgi:hypothetical protein